MSDSEPNNNTKNRNRKRRQRSDEESPEPQTNKRRRLNIEDDEETEEDDDIDEESLYTHFHISENSNNSIERDVSPHFIPPSKRYIFPREQMEIQQKFHEIAERCLQHINMSAYVFGNRSSSNNNDMDTLSLSSSVEQKSDTEMDALKQIISNLRKENKKLKTKLVKETDKNEKYLLKLQRKDQRIKTLKAKLKDKEQHYCLIIKGLAHRCINGHQPRYDVVKMYKKDAKYSKKMHDLQKKLWNDLDDESIINVEIMDIEQLKQQIPSNLNVKKSIEKYLEINCDETHKFGLDQTEPLIKMAKTTKSFDEVVAVFDITQHRIPQLYGQKGVRSLIKVPKNTCLGQYVGVYRTKSEYEKIFNNSNQLALRDQYSYDMSLSIGDGQDIDCVIDGFGLESATNEICLVSKVNDCRLDINDDKPSEDDAKHQNVVFVQAKINEWPAIFIISTRNIQAGEELLGYYGEEFGAACKDKDEFDQFKDYMRTLVNEKILGDLPKIDVWDLTSDS